MYGGGGGISASLRSLPWAPTNPALTRIGCRSPAPFGLVSLVPVRIPSWLIDTFRHPLQMAKCVNGGGGIRTHVPLARTAVFETAPL